MTNNRQELENSIGGRYLEPQTDVTFRRICGTEKNKKITIAVCNAMLNLSSPIVDIQFKNTQQIPPTPKHKECVVDIFAQDQKGNQLILEMQLHTTKEFAARSVKYAFDGYSNQAMRGGNYNDSKPVYLIALTDQIMFHDHEHYESTHRLIEETTGVCHLDMVTLKYFEFPKFKKNLSEISTLKEKLLYFFFGMCYKEVKGIDDIPDKLKEEEVIMDALKELDMKNWHLHDLLTYKTIQDRERDHNTLINAKTNEAWDKGRTEGRTEGEAIGMARGRTEGEVIGMARGIAEGRTEGETIGKYFTARNMLENGISAEIVARCTGLSIDEIRKLI